MPYSDPVKRRAANARAQQKRYRQKKDAIKLKKIEHYDKTRPKRLKQMRERNRAAGHAERPKGARALPELVVSAARKWHLFRGPDGTLRLYFTSRKGYTLEEMREIMKQFRNAE